MDRLETPEDAEDLYLARGSEVDPNRPIFTGDVLAVEGQLALLLQHPCAMRRGGTLAPMLLAASVKSDASIPQDWHSNYRKMFLPNLHETSTDSAAEFDDILVLTSDDASGAQRVATLSEVGVAYLMQRWVYHNTRVRVATRTFIDTLAPQTEEADLETDWVGHFVGDDGGNRSDAATAFHAWLDENQRARRTRLVDSAGRAAIRRELRVYLGNH